MDRISFNQYANPTASPAMLREPKLIDASARLKIADRADTVELSSQARGATPTGQAQEAPTPTSAKSVSRLVAARVTEPAGPANVTTAAARAMRFYADPSEQNAAATLGAGSSLDVLA